MGSRTLTVFLVDLKGYTPRVAASSREEVRDLLRKFRGLITQVIRRCGGRVIKEIGDAFLVAFESPTNAVTAGTLLQQLLRLRNAQVPESDRIEVRVAIHAGEVEDAGGDLIGDVVNTVSRVEDVTEPGEVYFTEAVFLTMNRNEVPSCEVGERLLKGLGAPVRLYRVLQDPADERYQKLLVSSPEGAAVGRLPRWVLALTAAAVLALSAPLIFLAWRGRTDPSVTQARRLAAAGRAAEAVNFLGDAYQQRVPPPEAVALVEEAAAAAVETRLAAADFAGARELARKWGEKWPSLGPLAEKVALAESERCLADDRPHDALRALKEAAAAGGGSWRLHLALSRLYARRDFLYDGRHTGIYLEAADELDAAIARCPTGRPLPAELQGDLWERFAAQPRSVGEAVDQRGRRLCQLVKEHLWPECRDRLLAGCKSPEDALRLNSYEVLELAKATAAADLVAYHAANLAYHHWPQKQTQALDYLKSVAPADRPRALEALRAAAAKLAAKGDRDSLEMVEKLKPVISALESPG